MEPKALLDILTSAVSRSVGHERVAVAYSGGLDSSLIAKLASAKTETQCYSCVTNDSSDARRVAAYGKADELEVRIFTILEKEMPSVVSRAATAMSSDDPLAIAYSIPVMVVMERCEERRVLAGNGADELFGGYAKYTRDSVDLNSRMREDLMKSLREAHRLDDFAQTLGKRVCFPFLSDDIVTAAREIPLEQKISGDSRKAILRNVGELMHLAAADRPKKAAQYSSGTMKMMKSLAKRENLTIEEWTLNAISEHTFGKN